MQKWLQLLIISAILCFLTSNTPVLRELAATAVMSFGISWIISEIKKPIAN